MHNMFASDEDLRNAILELHNQRPHLAVIYTTGGAAGLQQLLWQVEGSSRTVLYCGFPYKQFFLERVIGGSADHACSPEMALKMAVAAYLEALECVQRNALPNPVIGLGITCALATDRERKGGDRIHIAVKTASEFRIESFFLTKGQFTRSEQGQLADIEGLNYLLEAAEASRVQCSWRGGKICEDSASHRTYPTLFAADFCDDDEILEDLLLKDEAVFFDAGGRWYTDLLSRKLTSDRHILYPGSFAPMTYGHAAVAATVRKQTGKEPVFTISRSHPAKPTLGAADVVQRFKQFYGLGPAMLLPSQPLYIDKARRFPGFGMVIGVDALQALQDPQYYGDSLDAVEAVIREFASLGTRFYVVGRLDHGAFRTLRDIEVFPGLRDLCTEVQGDQARWDISSTMVRNRVTTD